MRKWLFVPFIGLTTFTMYSNMVPARLSEAPVTQTVSLPLPSPTSIPTPDIPAHLSVPAIQLDSQILPVGLTSENLVEVPITEVGWYKNGIIPGTQGNAVLDGHFSDRQLNPGVFHNLSKLAVGDDVFVTDQNSQQVHFKVTRIDIVPVREFPVEEVYGYSENYGLNLITCAGTYDKNLGTYTHRTIVYTQKN